MIVESLVIQKVTNGYVVTSNNETVSVCVDINELLLFVKQAYSGGE